MATVFYTLKEKGYFAWPRYFNLSCPSMLIGNYEPQFVHKREHQHIIYISLFLEVLTESLKCKKWEAQSKETETFQFL